MHYPINERKSTMYSVDQDGDCWLVPVGMEFDELRGYYWPDESDDNEEEC